MKHEETYKHLHEIYPLLRITWIDVTSRATWEDMKKFKKRADNLPIITSVGYLIEEKQSFFLLAATVCPQDDQVSDTIIIPKGMVLSKTEIKIVSAEFVDER